LAEAALVFAVWRWVSKDIGTAFDGAAVGAFQAVSCVFVLED